MRDILFRGKRLDNGEWVEGDLAHCNEIGTKREMICIWYTDSNGLLCEAEVDPSTVGQYTGLTDMQDVKIFEGDIVQFGGEYGKIEYSETEAMFQVVFYGWLTDFDHLRGTVVDIEGNIHDNPELLEADHG